MKTGRGRRAWPTTLRPVTRSWAFGAPPTRLLLRSLRQGALLVLVGLSVGSLSSMLVADALQAVVPGSPGRIDVSDVAGAAGVLIMVGVAAVLPAARRAARMDPLAVLRGD